MPTRPSRRFRAALTLVFASLLLLSACGGVVDPMPVDEAATDTAPTAAVLSGEFETIRGAQIDLASLEGQDVVLWFWAPW